MKIAPIARAIEAYNNRLQLPSIKHLIVHTGQHYDDAMSLRFFEDLQLPIPDMNLEVGSSSHALQTAKIMERFEPFLLKEKPDVLLIVGDVNSTLACALVASKIEYNGATKRKRPIIGHVEAGLRSYDRGMPEEINRVLADALSDLLFVTESDAIKNLELEGIVREKIHFVGNVMIDTLIMYQEKARQFQPLDTLEIVRQISETNYGIVTLHRPSNVDDPKCLSGLVECLLAIAQRIPLILPLHPRTKNNLSRFGLENRLTKCKSIFLTRPLGYLEFLSLLLKASLVLTDSGGIQEETTYLQIPCITLRENTERPVTIHLGTNYLVGTDPQRILNLSFDILEGKKKKSIIPPFWDGHASKRILDILIKLYNS